MSSLLLRVSQLRNRHAEPLDVGSHQAEINLGAVDAYAGDLVDAVGAYATYLVANLWDSLRGFLGRHGMSVALGRAA